MICILHNWKPFKTEIVSDISFGEPGVAYTYIFYQCKKCSKIKSKKIHGHFNINDLKNN